MRTVVKKDDSFWITLPPFYGRLVWAMSVYGKHSVKRYKVIEMMITDGRRYT